MQKLWTLCQAMGEKATTLLCAMHNKYTDKLPLLHTWPVASAPFKQMPKLAQYDVLASFFKMYEDFVIVKKTDIKALREGYETVADFSSEAKKHLEQDIRAARKRCTVTKHSTSIFYFVSENYDWLEFVNGVLLWQGPVVTNSKLGY